MSVFEEVGGVEGGEGGVEVGFSEGLSFVCWRRTGQAREKKMILKRRGRYAEEEKGRKGRRTFSHAVRTDPPKLFPRHMFDPTTQLREEQRQPRRVNLLHPLLLRKRPKLLHFRSKSRTMNAGVVPPRILDRMLDDGGGFGVGGEDGGE